MAHYNYIPGVYNPPITHYSQLDVPEYVNIGLLVGKEGRNFKYFTRKSGCSYIWYNKDTKVIELWGPMNSLENAKQLIQTRMDTMKPEKTLEELEAIVTDSDYVRENGQTVYEMEGPEWAVRDFANKKFGEYMIDDTYKVNEHLFWMKIVLI
jgi:hypothetical protein